MDSRRILEVVTMDPMDIIDRGTEPTPRTLFCDFESVSYLFVYIMEENASTLRIDVGDWHATFVRTKFDHRSNRFICAEMILRANNFYLETLTLYVTPVSDRLH